MNKPTKDYLDAVLSGNIIDVFIDKDGLVGASEQLRIKIHNLLDKRSVIPLDTFSSFPYLKCEGMFSASIIDKRNLENSEGIVLLIDSPSLSSKFRIGIFYNGFSHSAIDKISIEELSSLFAPGDEIVFRMGANYRKSKYYVRYIRYKDYELGREKEWVFW